MEWGLILTLCVVLTDGTENCDDYISDVLPTMNECLVQMDAHKGQPADRYFSCAPLERADKAGKP